MTLTTYTCTISVDKSEKTLTFRGIHLVLQDWPLRYQIDRHLTRCAAHRQRRRKGRR